jgi:hypothetical protein
VARVGAVALSGIVIAVCALLPLLALTSFAPGFLFVRRLPWSPPEKLVAAVGLSLLLVHSLAFAVFVAGLPRWSHLVVTALAGASLVAASRDVARLLRHATVRRWLAAYGFLLVWALALLSLVRHYSGGLWAGDWIEHYERALYFLEHFPPEFVFVGDYRLPARPPMMNVLAAHFLAQVGRAYEMFQLTFVFLNLLIVLPLMLVATALVHRASRRTLFVAGFLAASPMLLQNATFTWTKLLAGFYVLLGLWLYLRAWRKHDPVRMALAFGALATGVVVHYSAGPYAVFVGLHYALVVLRSRERRWHELAAGVLLGALVLLPWFAWSVAVYGTGTTLSSNTTVAGVAGVSPTENVARTVTNLVNSVVPHPLRAAGRAYMQTWFQQKSTLGWIRDYTFLIYQVNAAGALGVAGGLLALYLVYRRRRAAPSRALPEMRFWLAFVVATFVLGIAVHGTPDDVGLVHICLQPLMLLGVVFVAASVPDLPPWLRIAALAGCAVDFTVGVLLQFAMQNYVATVTTLPAHPGQLIIVNDMGLSQVAALNWGYGAIHSMRFFGERFAPAAGAIEGSLALAYAVVLALMWRRLQSTRR